MKTFERPYPEPEPRSFDQWCHDLGLECETPPTNDNFLTWDAFCFFENTVFRKTSEKELYAWWRKYGDQWGECRTVKEWIQDFNWVEEELDLEDKKDLNLFLGHDEFWVWSSGKLSRKKRTNPESFQ